MYTNVRFYKNNADGLFQSKYAGVESDHSANSATANVCVD